VLHERVSPAAILSAILVLVGVALVLFQRRPVEQRPPPAALATATELDH
jgi:drug/metabolite transporter (DMT)-like permease